MALHFKSSVIRAGLFAATAVGLIVLWVGMHDMSHHSDATAHIFLETTSTCLALLVGLIAAVRFYSKPDFLFLSIAVGYVGSAMLSSSQTLLTSPPLMSLVRSAPDTVEAWNWIAGRIFLSACLLLGYVGWRQEHNGRSVALTAHLAWRITAAYCFTCIAMIAIVPLPPASFELLNFPRAIEFLPAIIFAAALIGFLNSRHWQQRQLECWLILALSCNVVGQSLFMAHSEQMHDAMFDAAHVLNIVSYGLVHAGLLIDLFTCFGAVQTTASELTKQIEGYRATGAQLGEEQRNLRLSLDAVKAGMWWWDINADKLKWDRRMHKLFGVEQGAFGQTHADWLVRVHSDDADRARRRSRDAVAGKRPYDDTYRVVLPSGRTRFVRDRGVVLRDDQGNATRVVGHCVDVTDTVRSNQKLAESEQRFRTLADHAPVLIWMAEPNRRLTYFNQQWLDFTGRSLRQESGEGWALGVHPDDRQSCNDVFEAAFEARKPFQHEIRLRSSEGEYRWFLNTATPRFTEDGTFLGFIGTCVEITRLNEAMQSLRVTQFALDRAPDAVFWVMPDGRFLYVNDQACRTLGYSANELKQLRVPDVDVNIPAEAWPEFWKRIRTESITKLNTQIRCKNGTLIPTELTIGFVETPDGEMACAFARDVTERNRQQEELGVTQQRFDLAVRGTGEGIWDWEVGSGQVWYAPRFAELLGYAPDEWPHTLDTFNEHLHPDDYDATWSAVQTHLEEKVAFDVEYRLRHKGGGYRWFRARGTTAHDEQGNPKRMAGSIQDIQAHKQAQAALLQSVEDLRQFAFVASHDLQEPLRSIAHYCGLLQQQCGDNLDEQAAHWINDAINATQRLQEMVRGLLDYSRLDTRAQTFAQVDMNQVVACARQNLRAVIEESGAQIECSELPVVDGDQTQLIQLIQNLVDNGIKYRRSNVQPEIRINADQKEQQFVFRCQDNGIGIAPLHHDRVFEVFRRLHLPEEYSGTGIGLAFCRKVLQRHGGKIWIESDGKTGTTINFTLPVPPDTEGQVA